MSVKATSEMQEDNPRQEVLCPNNTLPTQTARQEEESQTEINHTKLVKKEMVKIFVDFIKLETVSMA